MISKSVEFTSKKSDQLHPSSYKFSSPKFSNHLSTELEILKLMEEEREGNFDDKNGK